MNKMCHKHIEKAIATMDLDTVTKDSGVLAKVREPKLMDMVTYQYLSVLWIRISISNTVGMIRVHTSCKYRII